jgi:3'-5' exoribonuclease
MLTTPVALPNLAVGDRVQETLLVFNVQHKSLADGRGYTVLTLSNATGRIDTAPFWPEQHDLIAGVERGHVAQVIGEVQTYRERKQLVVTSLRVLPREHVDPSSLLPSVGDVAPYWHTLDGWRRAITKPRLRAVIDLFYEDDEFRARYGRCPASIAGHHAAVGGLLKHTVEVAHIARAISRAAGADPELVLAGVLLHDIGKLDAYRWDTSFEHTDRGHLAGHVALGALMLDRRVSEQTPPVCTPEECDTLIHLVLAHHGRLEFGSPVVPMTLEAEVLHWADNASAKTASMADALRDASAFGEGLVSRQRFWQLDGRRAYRGRHDWGE